VTSSALRESLYIVGSQRVALWYDDAAHTGSPTEGGPGELVAVACCDSDATAIKRWAAPAG
jgi:hypothetical protein